MEKRKGITGSTLKIIAVITMVIDHIGAVVLTRLLMANGYLKILNSNDVNIINMWLADNGVLYYTCMAMRMIGRLAFPIFCFLLVEGFQRTRNVGKYAMRLGVFALISEVPFDLALTSKVVDFTYQNVFFTLLLGLLTMQVFDWIGRQEWNHWGKLLLCVFALLTGAVTADLLCTDYGSIGVIAIMLLFLLRNNKRWQTVAGCVAFLWEITAPLAFIFIRLYNGERGRKLKYFFYAFYPIHLLILYLICRAMGIAGYSAV